MDLFGSPGVFISSTLIGLVGTALFLYGKKQPDLRCLFTGIGFCVYPFFVHSLIVMWLLFAACMGGLYAAAKYR